MTAHSELVARLEGASEVLRANAEWKAKVHSFPGPNTIRDGYADALAAFAETVVEILRAKEPQPDGEKT